MKLTMVLGTLQVHSQRAGHLAGSNYRNALAGFEQKKLSLTKMTKKNEILDTRHF